MKSKTSYFNRTLFLDMFRRFWPIFLAYFIIWAVILPISLNNMLRWQLENGGELTLALEAGGYIFSAAQLGGVIMSLFFGALMSMAAFGYLYNSRSISMMGALPIKREGVFLSHFSAVTVGMLAINLLVFAAAAAVEGFFGVFSPGPLLQGFAVVSLMNLFFLGFGALCASFTGHLAVMPVVYVLLNFTALVVEFLARTVYQAFVYGSPSTPAMEHSMYATPALGLFQAAQRQGVAANGLADGEVVAYQLCSWPVILIYALVGLVFALCALLLIKHRRMETAADVVAVKPLKPVFKYCMTLGCALVLGTVMYVLSYTGGSIIGGGIKQMLVMLAFMLLGAAIGYFSSEMLMKKTFRVFSGRSWAGYLISAVLICAVMLGCEYDAFGYERYLPETEQVQGVSISCQGNSVNSEKPENIEKVIELHRSLVENKDFYENGEAKQGYSNVYLTYTMKNGSFVQREYRLFYEGGADNEALNEIFNTEEAIITRTSTYVEAVPENIANAYLNYNNPETGNIEELQITPEQASELYNTCIVPDVADSSIGRVYIWQNGTQDEQSSTSLRMTLMRRKDGETKYIDYGITVTMDAERTIAWLKENLNLTVSSAQQPSGDVTVPATARG